MFDLNKLTVKPVTEEPDVKSVLAKVELDAVDAGVVYVTDVKAAGAKVVGVEIPAAQNVSTEYPIATLKAARTRPLRRHSWRTCSPLTGRGPVGHGVRRTLTVSRDPTGPVRRARLGLALLVVLALLGLAFLLLPLAGLIIRAPWDRLPGC